MKTMSLKQINLMIVSDELMRAKHQLSEYEKDLTYAIENGYPRDNHIENVQKASSYVLQVTRLFNSLNK